MIQKANGTWPHHPLEQFSLCGVQKRGSMSFDHRKLNSFLAAFILSVIQFLQ
jgi:hypothetical protein